MTTTVQQQQQQQQRLVPQASRQLQHNHTVEVCVSEVFDCPPVWHSPCIAWVRVGGDWGSRQQLGHQLKLVASAVALCTEHHTHFCLRHPLLARVFASFGCLPLACSGSSMRKQLPEHHRLSAHPAGVWGQCWTVCVCHPLTTEQLAVDDAAVAIAGPSVRACMHTMHEARCGCASRPGLAVA